MEIEGKGKSRFRSLTFTLALAFLSLSAGLLIISSVIFVSFSLSSQQDMIAEEQNLIAENAANTVRGFLQERLGILSAAAAIGDISDEEASNIELEKMIGIEPSIRQVFLLDMEGNVLLSASRLSKLVSGIPSHIEMEMIIERISAGENYISNVYIDDATSEPMILISVPVRDVFGDLKGIILSELNLKFMWDLVDGIKIGNSGVAYVVDKEGTLLAFGDVSRVLKRENLNHLDEVREFVRGEEDHHVSSAETSIGILGKPVVANHAHLEYPDWAVIVEMPIDEAYIHVNLEIMIAVVTIITSIVIAVLIGVYLSRRISRPVLELRDAAIKIGSGKLDTKIKGTSSRNEIGELSDAFVKMTEDLKKSRKEIEDYSRNLEKKVKDRTTELEKSKNELEEKNVELERFNKLAVGRELKMIELKKKIRELESKKVK